MTIIEAGEALRARRISCVELTQECLARINQENGKLNAFITVTAEAALTRAAELDRELADGLDRGPLHGIPTAHKDLICTAGVRTTCGSKLFADYTPDHDATVVRKLDEAGTITVGKTGLHELAYGITSTNPHFGAIRNSHDPARIPGGSSGGSAVAVAAGMALLATGTDTGGSIRIPAALCGIAGIKPTYGLASRHGVRPLGLTLDHIGPLAATAGDTALALNAIAGHDPLDNSSSARRFSPLPYPLNASLAGARIGIPRNYYFDSITHGVRAAVEGAVKTAESHGAVVVPLRVPDIDALNTVARVILLAEATAVYERFLNQRHMFGSDVLALLEQGCRISASEYINAQRLRKMLVEEFRTATSDVEVLFTPTTPITAPTIGEAQIEIDGAMLDTRIAITRFMRGINVLGWPAMSIPCGRGENDMPVGLQIIGKPFEDRRVLEIGAGIEQLLS